MVGMGTTSGHARRWTRPACLSGRPVHVRMARQIAYTLTLSRAMRIQIQRGLGGIAGLPLVIEVHADRERIIADLV